MTEPRIKAPVLYAGTKFYDLIMQSMGIMRECMLRGDYYGWVLTLRQMYGWCSGHVKDEELLKEIDYLVIRARSIQGRMNGDSQFKKRGMGFMNDLRERISVAEMRFFTLIKDLLLKSGGDESLEMNMDELNKMIE